ncbi:MAG: penicillin-binding protein [Steroidobacteraceae bacterium]
MSDKSGEDCLYALKIAFCYMPKAIEVNQYDYGDRVEKVLSDIHLVRQALLAQGIDPEEVQSEMNPGATGPSCV